MAAARFADVATPLTTSCRYTIQRPKVLGVSRRLQLSHGVRADTAGYCVLFQLAVHVLSSPAFGVTADTAGYSSWIQLFQLAVLGVGPVCAICTQQTHKSRITN